MIKCLKCGGECRQDEIIAEWYHHIYYNPKCHSAPILKKEDKECLQK